MASVNAWTVTGHLGRDPELRTLDGGKTVCNMSVAVNVRRDETLWVRVSVWGRQAENCANYLSKGSLVGVSGALNQRVWEKDGKQGVSLELNASDVTFLGGRQDGPREVAEPADGSDDIPF